MRGIDIFGNEVEIPESSRKTLTMQQRYGVAENGKTCTTCAHRYKHRWYNKCALWDSFFAGMSSASDIRLKDPACGKYKEVIDEQSTVQNNSEDGAEG